MRFVGEDKLRCASDRAVADNRRRIRALLGDVAVQHVGSTAVPGALTKGDVDLVVIVEPSGFAGALAALRDLYAIHQPENWTPTYASFADPTAGEPPVGVQLVVAGSVDEDLFVPLRDLLRRDPTLLAAYNQLKRNHEGSDYATYTAAKDRFWAPVLERLRAARRA